MDAPLVCTIAGIGDLDPVQVELNGIDWSRGISLNGTCSAEINTPDLATAGLLSGPDALDDQWLIHQHPTLGPWAGEVQETRHALESRTTEIAAQDWSSLLEGRRAPRQYTISPAASPGDVLTRLILDAGRIDAPLWIEDVIADNDGWPIALTIRADQISDAFRQIVTASGMEYRFNPDRTVELRRQFGTDRSHEIQLVYGSDIVGGFYLSSRRSVVNDLYAVPSNDAFARSQAFVVEDVDSIQAGRRRQGAKVYPGFVGKSVMRPLATADLARMVQQGKTPTLDICDDNRVFGEFAAGDTVRVLLPTINAAFRMRVLVESWSSDTGLLRVSGVVEAED